VAAIAVGDLEPRAVEQQALDYPTTREIFLCRKPPRDATP